MNGHDSAEHELLMCCQGQGKNASLEACMEEPGIILESLD